MSFKAGDKVVCVVDASRSDPLQYALPHRIPKGETVYCVTSYYEINANYPRRIGISGFKQFYRQESIDFNADRFRLVHRCTDSVSVENEQEADR